MVPEGVTRERQLRDDFLSGQGVPRPPLGREASREHVLRPATAGSGARGHGGVILKLLLNEQETTIPALGPGPYYDWDAFRAYAEKKL